MPSRSLLSTVGLALLAASCLVEVRDLRVGSGGAGEGGEAPATSEGGAGGTSAVTASCPDDMVHVADADRGVDFCIDATEVTQASYLKFLAALNGPPSQPPACASNTELSHTPDGTCPDFATASDLPVYCVDWCDARAYCEWAGRRLCRGLDGEALGFDEGPVAGEWHFACSGGLSKPYPYGDSADPSACHIDGMIDKAPVMSFPKCEGGYPGIFDMQGNVHEWVDACESEAATARCRVRGGGTYGSATQWACNRVEDQMGVDRLDPDNRTVGIRCCRDPD